MLDKSTKSRKGSPATRPASPGKAATRSRGAAAGDTPVAAAGSAPRDTVGSVLSQEERRRMVAEAAYYRAERRGFRGDPVRDWAEAEAEIDAMLLIRR